MKRLNSKGFVDLVVLAPYIIGACYAVVAYGVTQTDFRLSTFRQNKAHAICQAEGKTADECTTIVAGMDKDQVLAYIKDTQESPK